MANAIMDYNTNWVSLEEEESDGAGKLQLPTLAESNTAESAKNRAVQKVAPRVHQIRRRIPKRRLFHQARNLFDLIIVGSRIIESALVRHLRRLRLHHQQHRTTTLLSHPNHLTHGGGGLNDPTGKRDREIVPIGV